MTHERLAQLTRRNKPIPTEHGMYVTVEYLLWRDQLRRWRWLQTDHGTYVQVEDK
jgi:hypothetical protein